MQHAWVLDDLVPALPKLIIIVQYADNSLTDDNYPICSVHVENAKSINKVTSFSGFEIPSI